MVYLYIALLCAVFNSGLFVTLIVQVFTVGFEGFQKISTLFLIGIYVLTNKIIFSP
jgi:hypothetical protein